MREGKSDLCSECGAPIPPERGLCALTCSPDCRARRDRRRKRERTGQARGPGSPSPRPPAAPPHRRPPSDPPTPPPDLPLPINDPTSGELRRHLLAEAEALLSLPHVAVVTVDVRAGEVRVLRVGPPGESVVDVLRGLSEIQDAGRAASHAASAYGERHGYHNPRGADLDFGGVP